MPYFQVSFWGACASFLFNISLRRFYFFQMLLLQMDMCRFYSKIKRILLKILSDCAMLFQNAISIAFVLVGVRVWSAIFTAVFPICGDSVSTSHFALWIVAIVAAHYLLSIMSIKSIHGMNYHTYDFNFYKFFKKTFISHRW